MAFRIEHGPNMGLSALIGAQGGFGQFVQNLGQARRPERMQRRGIAADALQQRASQIAAAQQQMRSIGAQQQQMANQNQQAGYGRQAAFMRDAIQNRQHNQRILQGQKYQTGRDTVQNERMQEARDNQNEFAATQQTAGIQQRYEMGELGKQNDYLRKMWMSSNGQLDTGSIDKLKGLRDQRSRIGSDSNLMGRALQDAYTQNYQKQQEVYREAVKPESYGENLEKRRYKDREGNNWLRSPDGTKDTLIPPKATEQELKEKKEKKIEDQHNRNRSIDSYNSSQETKAIAAADQMESRWVRDNTKAEIKPEDNEGVRVPKFVPKPTKHQRDQWKQRGTLRFPPDPRKKVVVEGSEEYRQQQEAAAVAAGAAGGGQAPPPRSMAVGAGPSGDDFSESGRVDPAESGMTREQILSERHGEERLSKIQRLLHGIDDHARSNPLYRKIQSILDEREQSREQKRTEWDQPMHETQKGRDEAKVAQIAAQAHSNRVAPNMRTEAGQKQAQADAQAESDKVSGVREGQGQQYRLQKTEEALRKSLTPSENKAMSYVYKVMKFIGDVTGSQRGKSPADIIHRQGEGELTKDQKSRFIKILKKPIDLPRSLRKKLGLGDGVLYTKHVLPALERYLRRLNRPTSDIITYPGDNNGK